MQSLVFGVGTLHHLVVAGLVALIIEIMVERVRPGAVLASGARDGSALITVMLIAVSVPSGAAWWVPGFAVSAGLLLAKHAYGGLGYNLFNPAIAGYAIALVSFPEEMTNWYSASLVNPAAQDWLLGPHTVSGATPLDSLRADLHRPEQSLVTLPSLPNGVIMIAFAYVLGGALVLGLRVVHWRLPFAFLLAVGIGALLCSAVSNDIPSSPWFHWVNGATALAAFFILTDPVTAPISAVGQWCFAVIIGLLVVVIRSWGEYADGIAFAVLTGNMLTPMLDRWAGIQASKGRG